MSDRLEFLLDRKVQIELGTYCPNKLDCSKCKELCPEVEEYNWILNEIEKEEVTTMSRRWVIADLHFGHANVIAYSQRPFADVEEMERELIKKWNNKVSKDDVVYILGDFTLSRRTELISRLCGSLNGHKVLVMGNHDTRKPADYIACGFRTAVRKPILVDSRVILSHEPPAEEDIFYGMKYIFGHVHNKKCAAELYGNCRCVSVERTNYEPVDLDQLLETMDPNEGERIGY